MSGKSPIVDQIGRLASLLREYGREDLWLHVIHVHPLSSQHPQVVVAVEDRNGAVLHERSGRVRPHTFRLDHGLASIRVGHRFYVAQDESGVRVEHVPAFSCLGA